MNNNELKLYNNLLKENSFYKEKIIKLKYNKKEEKLFYDFLNSCISIYDELDFLKSNSINFFYITNRIDIILNCAFGIKNFEIINTTFIKNIIKNEIKRGSDEISKNLITDIIEKLSNSINEENDVKFNINSGSFSNEEKYLYVRDDIREFITYNEIYKFFIKNDFNKSKEKNKEITFGIFNYMLNNIKEIIYYSSVITNFVSINKLNVLFSKFVNSLFIYLYNLSKNDPLFSQKLYLIENKELYNKLHKDEDSLQKK